MKIKAHNETDRWTFQIAFKCNFETAMSIIDKINDQQEMLITKKKAQNLSLFKLG